MRCAVVPADGWHVLKLGDNLRAHDALEITSLGVTVRRALWASYRGSLYAKTLFVDGEIGAMAGLGGEALGNEGTPWLLTTAAVEAVPIAFYKLAQAEIAHMLDMRPKLSNFVASHHTRSLRLLKGLGFTLEPERPFGPASALFRRFSLERGA